ncbi:hypothetical protein [Granulosicoccus antarcticus]|uniref:Uncharacterized protein n=1 Tax=Granulosicoccus antarcticus IMCC3135 TaxID=1192854 RepID=A0A2Z2NWU7_9GAMM|nr:hypothetical protein [Granulosicoccus antarcticus]ASJ71634.1 hypothetical protein IMCC3135_07645 [Granulosicoccus antarcticus IMCC3135]
MNVEIELGVDGCKTQICLDPELYDGHPPIEAIIYHTRMRLVDPNLVAVSLAIVLQEYASESIVYQHGVQAHVAEAIESFFSRRFRLAPVERIPAAIPLGTRQVRIGDDGSDDSDTAVFELGNSGSFMSSASLGRIHIASNLPQFFSNDLTGLALANLSAATFVAADYALGELRLVGNFADQFDDDEFLRYRNLLDSVNLKLTRGETI